MKDRKLNLEEPLIPPPPPPSNSASSLQLPSMQSHDHHHPTPRRELVEHEQEQYPQAQPLTIFYNGQVSTCTVDEFQARAILLVAMREMEEAAAATLVSPTRRRSSSSSSLSEAVQEQPPPSSSSRRPAQAQLGRSLSMKRSLQQFLHKRNHRINSSNPNPPHQ